MPGTLAAARAMLGIRRMAAARTAATIQARAKGIPDMQKAAGVARAMPRIPEEAKAGRAMPSIRRAEAKGMPGTAPAEKTPHMLATPRARATHMATTMIPVRAKGIIPHMPVAQGNQATPQPGAAYTTTMIRAWTSGSHDDHDPSGKEEHAAHAGSGADSGASHAGHAAGGDAAPSADAAGAAAPLLVHRHVAHSVPPPSPADHANPSRGVLPGDRRLGRQELVIVSAILGFLFLIGALAFTGDGRGRMR